MLLSYLPRILSLSLSGLDPNDHQKTTQTLAFYITLTNWLPILHPSSMNDDSQLVQLTFPPVDSAEAQEVNGEKTSVRELEENAEEFCLSAVLFDWALAVLERVFVLLEAQPEPVKHGGGHHNLMHHILVRQLLGHMDSACQVTALLCVSSYRHDMSLRIIVAAVPITTGFS